MPSPLPSLAQELILNLLPALVGDPRILEQVRDHVVKEIKADAQGLSRREWAEVKNPLVGLARTAKVRVQTGLADALEKVVEVLEGHRQSGQGEWEGDMPIQMSNLPQHVHMLLCLANPSSSSAHQTAHEYLSRRKSDSDPDRVLFDSIMGEPFIGAHWGPSEEKEADGWDDSLSSSSSAEKSSGNEEQIVTPLKERIADKKLEAELLRKQEEEDRFRRARELLKEIQDRSYWARGGEVVEVPDLEGIEGWKDVICRTDALGLAARLDVHRLRDQIRAVSAAHLQRELLFALSSRPGVFFGFQTDGECLLRSDHPQVRHFSPSALCGILEAFQSRCARIAALRSFIYDVSQLASSTSRAQPRPSKTKQAFAEACRNVLENLDGWLAELEASFSLGLGSSSSSAVPGTSAGTTALLLRIEVDDRFGGIIDHLTTFVPHADSPVLLLNTIFSTIQSLQPTLQSSDLLPLLDVFIASASPHWALLERWLIQGMPLPASLTSHEPSTSFDDEPDLDPEFCLKRDRDVTFGDEDFWVSAYVDAAEGWPLWLAMEGLRETVLEAGKARGLLRGMSGAEAQAGEWISLRDVLVDSCGHIPELDIAALVSAFLLPICQLTKFQLHRVLDEECALMEHLGAIEGLMNMRGYEAMDEWCKWLFRQMTTENRWHDFHLLTGSLRGIISKPGAGVWMNPSALRLRVGWVPKGPTDMQMLGAMQADYTVPFPLSQLFTSTSLELRSEVFAFLLQLRYAQYLLTQLWRPLLELHTIKPKAARRLWYGLSWFVNILWTWITERVIDCQLREHREKLESTTSLGLMISLELDHARRIHHFCFLHERTSEARYHLLRIFETITTLHANFGHAKMDQSSKPTRRRARRQSTDTSESDNSESDEERLTHLHADHRPSSATGMNSASPQQTIPNLAKDVADRVSSFTQEVTSLSENRDGGDGPSADIAIWAMLAFSLEDWR